jgi:hypothetical protein
MLLGYKSMSMKIIGLNPKNGTSQHHSKAQIAQRRNDGG